MSNKKKEHIPLDRKKVDVMYNNYMELNKLHWVNIRGGSFYIHPIVEGEDMEYVTTEMFKKLTDNFDSFVKSQEKFNKDQQQFNKEQRIFNNQVFEFMQRQDEHWKRQDKRWEKQEEFNKTVIKRLDNLDNRLDNIVVKNNLSE